MSPSPEAGTQPAVLKVLDDISGSWERALLRGRRFALGTTQHPATAGAVFSGTHLTPASPPVAAPCSGSRAFGGTCPIPNGAFPSLQWDTSHIRPPAAARPGCRRAPSTAPSGHDAGAQPPGRGRSPHGRGQPSPRPPALRGDFFSPVGGDFSLPFGLSPFGEGRRSRSFPSRRAPYVAGSPPPRPPLIAGLPRGSAASAARRPASPPGTRRRRRVSPSCRLSALRTSGLSPSFPASLPPLPPGSLVARLASAEVGSGRGEEGVSGRC